MLTPCSAAATLFAVALLAAGQSSSIIATVAGQAVSEGFLQWRVSVWLCIFLAYTITDFCQPIIRRLVTRMIAIIPSMIVAVAIGRSGIDSLLVVSQVVLSVVLPFITLPLIWLTSSKKIMGVMAEDLSVNMGPDDENPRAGQRVIDFSNGKLTVMIGAGIWLLVLTANVYVIVSLAIGTGG